MGVLFSTIRGALNLLLPFTNPQTPLIQDLLHTVILCGTLYFAPQIAEHYNANTHRAPPTIPAENDNNALQEEGAHIDVEAIEQEIRNDDNVDEDVAIPPPHAQADPIPQEWHNEDNEFARAAADAEGEAGPANANERPRPTAANRTVGTKKAKSLARRDQRRAYHEFHRSQAEQRRLAEEAGREEREKALAEAKLRRAEEERRIAEKLRAEREKRKEEERKEMEEERERRERAVEKVRGEMERCGAVDLGAVARKEGKDGVWIERLVRASGIVEKVTREGGEDCKVFFTGGGCWLVKVDAELMTRAYADAVRCGDEMGGKVSFERFGEILQKVVLARSQGTA